MEPIIDLVSQLKSAAIQIKGKIKALDTQLEESYRQRGMLIDATVTKDDFIAYVREDMRRKGKRFEMDICRNVGDLRREYATLDKLTSGVIETLHIPYLTRDRATPAVIDEAAVFFYFGDIIAKRISDAVATMKWPDNVMPVADIKLALGRIDAEIESIRKERNGLVSQLTEAGLSE